MKVGGDICVQPAITIFRFEDASVLQMKAAGSSDMFRTSLTTTLLNILEKLYK
jgi:hypothetical protein